MCWLEAFNIAVFNRLDIHPTFLHNGIVGAHNGRDFSFAAGLEGVCSQSTNTPHPHDENFGFLGGHCDKMFRTG